ncbi:MAG: zinc metallopeptidase [Clostridiales bacterium]|nr:zinc metallopeptidase [Clostridiales bacterium]
MPFFYFDYYYILFVIPPLIFAAWAQFKVKSTFHKYAGYHSGQGYTAVMIARQILDQNGLFHVKIEMTSGNLTDHFDPRANVIRLSESVYHSTSVASIGVAAHEVGHAIQYSKGYLPIKIRNAVIPLTNIGSTLAFPLAILGVIFSFEPLITIGIWLFIAVVFFQFITLPVEFNASRRALNTLKNDQILIGEEYTGAKKVLTAAALTYVGALLVAVGNLLRLLALTGRRRD